MNPWLAAALFALVWLGLAPLVGSLVGKLIDAKVAQREEDYIRRARMRLGERRDGSRECLDCGCVFIGKENHQLCAVCVALPFTPERDGHRSMYGAWAEMRRRKAGGA